MLELRPSRMLFAAALPGLLAVAGCAATPPPGTAAVDKQAALAFAADTARRVRLCYRQPRVASQARQIATALRVRYAADGSLIGLPMIVSQTGVTPQNRSYAGPMAEAAQLAVIRCAPIRVPRALTRWPWHEVDLWFSPGRMV